MLYRTVVQVVVRCDCGMMPLNSSNTAFEAWQLASKHHELNPSLCAPTLHREEILLPVRVAS